MGGAALDVARASRCRRLLSTGPCVASVAADFGEDAPLERVWPELTVTMLGGVLSVSGLVPDVASKRTVLDAARAAAAARVGVRSVRDELRVGSKASPAGVKPLLKRLTLAVSLCRAGSGTVRNGVTSFECRVDPLLQDSIRSLLATPLPAGDLLALELTATPTNSGDPAS